MDVDAGKYSFSLGTIFVDIVRECEKCGDYVINAVEAKMGKREDADLLNLDDLVIDHQRKTALLYGEPLDLTKVEFELLSLLVSNPGRVFTREELIDQGYGRQLFDLLNTTYKDLYGFSQLSDRQIDKLVNDYIKIADLNLVTAVMDGDKMVGFGITFPSFSEAMQKTRDGRFLPFGWWHLLKVLKWHKTPLVDLLLIGVLPEYRAKGANALIFDDLIRWFQRYHFEYAITGPQMESNEGVLSQWQYLEAIPYRRHRCYRKFL